MEGDPSALCTKSDNGLDIIFDNLKEVNKFTVTPEGIDREALNVFFTKGSVPKIPENLFKVYPRARLLVLHMCELEFFQPADLEDAEYLRYFTSNVNEIMELKANNFAKAPRLRYINLDSNRIEQVELNAFYGLHHLTDLDLQDNFIKKLPKGVFDCLPYLKRLNLSRNDLEVIPEKIFCQNYCLKMVSIECNSIKSIHRGVFIRDTTYHEIRLSNNNFNRFYGQACRVLDLSNASSKMKRLQLDYVENLNVANINIRRISLSDWKNLNTLNISGNPRLDLSVLRRAHRLEELNMSNMELKFFKACYFENLHELHTLNLCNNQLQSISMIIFEPLQSLRTLLLRENKLNEFNYRDLFEKLPLLKTIDIAKNLFERDFIKDFLDYIAEKSIKHAPVMMEGNILKENPTIDDLGPVAHTSGIRN